MKKYFISVFFLAVILCSGIFITSAINTATKQTSVINNNDTELNSLVLGDVKDSFSLSFEPEDLTFLSGAIWAASYNESKLYKIDPATGATITSINVSFEVCGLTTDGTYLYASLLDTGSGNGTIAKYHTNGSFVSKIYIPLNNHYFQGLAWDGSHLWASQIDPARVVRINVTTGTVVTNVSSGYPLVGLVWRNNLLWGSDNNANLIRAIDPTTGRTREVFDPPAIVGETGLAYNGTHFFFAEWFGTIYVLDIPADIGEVWNQHPSANDRPLDIAWNGTHYFLAEANAQKVYILHDGTFENVSDFDVGFEIYGITVADNYLYIVEYELSSPYYIYKYAPNGSLITSFTTPYKYSALEYDGSKLWGSRRLTTPNIDQLNLTDGSVIASHPVAEWYAGLTYDSVNDVFWAVGYTTDKIYQLNPLTFQKTGVEINSPTSDGDYGLEFNGEHLVMTSWGTDTLYKILVDLNAPWFEEVPTADWVEWGDSLNLTFRLHDDFAGGSYRITSNSTYSKNWTAWYSSDLITALVSGIGLGAWSFTVEFNDSVGKLGTQFVYDKAIVDLNPPSDSNPPDAIHALGATSNITWTLYDNVAGGSYRVYRNSTPDTSWTNWTNGSSYVISVNTTVLGVWNYTILYNDSFGLWGTPDQVLITIEDQINPWASSPADAIYAQNDLVDINWTLSDNVAGGFYLVLQNDTPQGGWTAWSSGNSFTQGIDTSTVGLWNITILYNDSVGLWGTPDLVWITIENVTPWDSDPPDRNIPQGTPASIPLTLYDNIGGGFYRVLRNNVPVLNWTNWTSSVPIDIIIDTGTAGVWNYTIQYNDSVGLPGAPVTVIVTVEEPAGGIPGYSTFYAIFGVISLILIVSRKRKPWKQIEI